jgi:hypothetical protein
MPVAPGAGVAAVAPSDTLITPALIATLEAGPLTLADLSAPVAGSPAAPPAPAGGSRQGGISPLSGTNNGDQADNDRVVTNNPAVPADSDLGVPPEEDGRNPGLDLPPVPPPPAVPQSRQDPHPLPPLPDRVLVGGVEAPETLALGFPGFTHLEEMQPVALFLTSQEPETVAEPPPPSISAGRTLEVQEMVLFPTGAESMSAVFGSSEAPSSASASGRPSPDNPGESEPLAGLVSVGVGERLCLTGAAAWLFWNLCDNDGDEPGRNRGRR